MAKQNKNSYRIAASDFDKINKNMDVINHNGNKPFTLTFCDKKVYQPDNSRAVVCEMTAAMKWNIPEELRCAYTGHWDNILFSVKGVALCHEDDEFDFKKGSLIAATKAENCAYEEAFRRLSLLAPQFNSMALACLNAMKNLAAYYKHNQNFMNDVIEGKPKPEKKNKTNKTNKTDK